MAITSRLVRIALIFGFMLERSLPANSGAASMAHSETAADSLPA